MWTAKWILDSYEEGNQSVRWDLYMSYPDLRECFDEIEALAVSPDNQKADTVPKKPAVAWWSHCCKLVRG